MAAERKSAWTSQLGFVLASAGSAVGLGNIWRFPYQAANGGGGLFLVMYIALACTVGFSLLATEISIGRKTGKSPIGAFRQLSSDTGKKVGLFGYLGYIVPFIIYSYYVVIGGWVTWYLMEFLTFHSAETTNPETLGFFSKFITHPFAPIFYTIVYSLISSFIVYKGVEEGIEKFSKYIMPLLFLLVVFISLFAIFLKSPDKTRTGLDGLKIYLIPSFKGVTFGSFLNICMSAVSQLFYSLSIAMGIMITYGSYAKKDVNLEKSIGQIAFFDTFVAFFAGLMIIPSVYVFMGREGLSSAGPGLIFVTLPKVFEAMGNFGSVIGVLFFFLVLFAALTSSVSLLETIVSDTMSEKKAERKKTTISVSLIEFALSLLVCLGYTCFYFEIKLPTGDIGQILDVFDYITNNFMMPILAIATSVFVGWIIKPDWVVEEMKQLNSPFKKEKMYRVLIKYVIPVLMLILFLNSNGIFRMIGNLFSK